MSLLVNPSPGIILLLSYTQCYMWGLILYNNPAFNRIYTQTLRVSCWQSETNTNITVADCLFEKTVRFTMSAHETHGNSSILNASSNLPLETSVILGLVGYNIFFLIRPINTKRETKASQFIQNLDLLFLFFFSSLCGGMPLFTFQWHLPTHPSRWFYDFRTWLPSTPIFMIRQLIQRAKVELFPII